MSKYSNMIGLMWEGREGINLARGDGGTGLAQLVFHGGERNATTGILGSCNDN
ncbi:hypothetical protein IG631_20807 [Alternaria alternata]|nr:hypothetical protein IG631_20807 [Alternaria alternata]